MTNYHCSTEDTYTYSFMIAPNIKVKVEGENAKLKYFTPLSRELEDKVWRHIVEGKVTEDYEFFFYMSKKNRPMMGIVLNAKTHRIVSRAYIERKIITAQKLAKDLKAWIGRH